MISEEFCRQQHVEYLLALDKSKDVDTIGMYLRNHLKIAGGYWCLTSLATLKVRYRIIADRPAQG